MDCALPEPPTEPNGTAAPEFVKTLVSGGAVHLSETGTLGPKVVLPLPVGTMTKAAYAFALGAVVKLPEAVTLEAVALAALAAVIDNDNKTNRVTSKTLMRFIMVLLLVGLLRYGTGISPRQRCL